MNNQLTPREHAYVGRVKALPCGVCGATGPSIAHHIVQHAQYLTIPLCEDCHVGKLNGIHRLKRIWSALKKTEMTVLNETLGLLVGGVQSSTRRAITTPSKPTKLGRPAKIVPRRIGA